MLGFITKKQYWDLEDSGVLGPISAIHDRTWDLKSIQDAIAHDLLRSARGQRIAEIGGGASRLLPAIAPQNECVNIEPFEGVGHGPRREVTVPGVKNISAMVGRFSPEIAPASFDIVYSISVVEHVGRTALSDFFRDCARILKPGGLMFHLIDIYLSDTPARSPKGKIKGQKRLGIYRETLANDFFRPSDPGQILSDPDPLFRTAYATNPDNIMLRWNHFAPALAERRAVTQSCTLLMGALRTDTPTIHSR